MTEIRIARCLGIFMLGVTLLTPLAASAHPRGPGYRGPPPWHDYRHHDNTGAIVGGALLGLGIGAVLGGAVAAPPPAVIYAPPPPPPRYPPPPAVYYAPPPAVYYGY